jgi:hypothetical protein
MRVCLVDPTGKTLKRLSDKNAEEMILSGVAERRSSSVIALKETSPAARAIPAFDELRDDTAHWVGVKNCSPLLSEEKQVFLRAMKHLSG